ncbi:hypothetical protein DFH09DRAFT_1078726 [Mycena vulgaris]|nr:hypothetical protein DFH09DRAFT_1078726 [Mycena vulgaris]
MAQPTQRPPDPRLFYAVPGGYLYRDPTLGKMDGGIFVPPQTAPTDAALLNEYLVFGAPPMLTAPPVSVAPLGMHHPHPQNSQIHGYYACDQHARGPSYAQRPPNGYYRRDESPPRYQTYPPPHRGRGSYRGGRPHSLPRNPRYDPVSSSSRSRGDSTNDNTPRRANNSCRNNAPPPIHYPVGGVIAIVAGAVVSAPFVAVPPHDVHASTVEHSAAGHPMFPLPDNVSDYVGSDDSASRRTSWARRNAEHIKKAVGGKPPRSPTLSDPAALGVWHKLEICMTTEAENLLDWASNGCPFSWAKVLHIQQHFGLLPMLKRNEGVGRVLSKQGDTRTRYFLATASAVPLSQRQQRTANTVTAAAPSTATGPGSSVAPTHPVVPTAAGIPAVAAADVEMLPVPPELEGPFIPSYLGMFPPGRDSREINSRSSESAAIVRWAKIPTSHWVRGLRNESGEYPTSLHEIPLANDVWVKLSKQLFYPENDGSTAGRIAYEQFDNTSMMLFSCPGLYARIVRDGGYHCGLLGPEHFNFMTSSITWSHVACWWAAHGLDLVSGDFLALESFARSWRNQAINQPTWNTTWDEIPTSSAFLLSFDTSTITPYADLEYPLLRAGLETSHPRRPAGMPIPPSPTPSNEEEMDDKDDRLDFTPQTPPG